jgi:hypothetical protein
MVVVSLGRPSKKWACRNKFPCVVAMEEKGTRLYSIKESSILVLCIELFSMTYNIKISFNLKQSQ